MRRKKWVSVISTLSIYFRRGESIGVSWVNKGSDRVSNLRLKSLLNLIKKRKDLLKALVCANCHLRSLTAWPSRSKTKRCTSQLVD